MLTLRQWTPSTTAIRWRTRKPNIQRPIPDHYIKAKYLAALEPIYPEPFANKPWYDACGNLTKTGNTEVEVSILSNFPHKMITNFSFWCIGNRIINMKNCWPKKLSHTFLILK